MSEETTEKSGKLWLYGLGFLLALPFLYYLSIGPVVVLFARKIISEEAIAVFILPFEWGSKVAGTDFGIPAYARAWCHATGTPWPP